MTNSGQKETREYYQVPRVLCFSGQVGQESNLQPAVLETRRLIHGRLDWSVSFVQAWICPSFRS